MDDCPACGARDEFVNVTDDIERFHADQWIYTPQALEPQQYCLSFIVVCAKCGTDIRVSVWARRPTQDANVITDWEVVDD